MPEFKLLQFKNDEGKVVDEALLIGDEFEAEYRGNRHLRLSPDEVITYDVLDISQMDAKDLLNAGTVIDWTMYTPEVKYA